MAGGGSIQAPRGTRDIFGDELERLERLERLCANTAKIWGYSGIRTPVFEHTGLFTRSIGEVTDIVEKEMFTIPRQTDKAGADSFTLRPENTAGVVRAYLEHNLHKTQGLTKLWYVGPQFRRERPQKGRLREFNQMGVEVLGLQKGDSQERRSPPIANLEVMLLATDILNRAGLKGRVVLGYNTVGCDQPGCRDRYREELKELLAKEEEKLCSDCRKRIERNVFRVLDCKKPNCRAVCEELLTWHSQERPEAFCEHCKAEIEFIKNRLDQFQEGYASARSWFLVRGLDYYTGAVFELSAQGLGAQDAVGGGGRYDGLIEELGGPSVGATGFALGLERILIAQQDAGVDAFEIPDVGPLVYVAPMLPPGPSSSDFFGYGTESQLQMADDAFRLTVILRRKGFRTEFDLLKHGRKIANSLRRASQLGARFAVIVGEMEAKQQEVKLKDMETREERRVKQADLAAEIWKDIG